MLDYRYGTAKASRRKVFAEDELRGTRLMAGRPAQTASAHVAFIGRERELGLLGGALDEVLAGRGTIVTLAGPAGIGKTRLSEEFARAARHQGVTVLQSHCHEEPAAPAYWPWTRLLERYAAHLGERAFEGLPDEDRAELATLAPRLAGLAVDVSAVSSVDPGRSRFRLFDAFARFWLDAVRRAPLVLVVDDLHWCDVPSLKLLEFLAEDIATAPLLLLLTYRDDELARRHPLSDTLGELTRRARPRRVALGGLAHAETARLIRAVSGRLPPPDRVALLHARSEGNPFYLLELLRYLAPAAGRFGDAATAGWLAGGSGDASGDASGEWLQTVPDGVRAIIGKRLNRLSPACERLLGVAAVIGRAFSTELLARLLETLSEETLWEALEEACAAHVIEPVAEEPDRHRFVHALIRETLYEEMLPARRMQLHRRCGELLEAMHGDEDGAHLPQLARHFAAAAPLGDAARAIALAERAARYASARLAHEEAARLYRLALRLLPPAAEPATRGDADAERHRCELLLALGDAQVRAGEGLEALQSLRAAAERASALGLARLAAHAAVAFEESSWRPGLSGKVGVTLLERARGLLGAPDTGNGALLARVLAALSRAHGFCGDVAGTADDLREEALALARRQGDDHALMMALRCGVHDRWRPQRLAARLRACEETLELAARADDPLQQTVDVLGWYLFDLLEAGDMEGIERELERYTRLVETLREPFYRYVQDTFRAGLAFHRGRFAEFERLVEAAAEVGSNIQGHETEGPYGLQMFSLRREQGRLAVLAPVIARFVQSTPAAATWRPGLALVYTELGERDAARREFESLAAADFTDLPHDGIRVCSLVFLAEVCARLGDRVRAALLYSLLESFAGHNVVVGAAIVSYGSADRYLGMLAATVRRWQSAERHFEAALASDARGGAAPWLAHTRERYAAMLEQRGQAVDRARARALAEGAASTAAELGMPRLERDARELGKRLGEWSGSGARRGGAPDELSRRELDVLRLLAEGTSNRGIAERLFISPHTVANHVRNILAKSGAANRTEAAAQARRAGLLDE